MTGHYSIVFNTTTGSRRSLRISNPNTDLPLATIQAAIGQMIQNDVFNQDKGGLESVKRMELTRIQHEIIL